MSFRPIARRTIRYFCLLGVSAILFCLATALSGQDKHWTNDAGGDFLLSENWDTGVPGPTDSAVFDLNAIYGVNLTADADILSWRQSNGTVDLFGGNSLTANSTSIDMGTFSLSGIGTSLLNSGPLSVGTQQTATLNVNSGSLMTSGGPNSTLGTASGSSGLVTVSGTDAIWNNSGFLNIERGTLTIEDGGFVSNALANIGGTTNSHGSVVVRGANSHWQSSVSIASSGSGELRIEDGGLVTGSGFIGRFGTGSATVTGAGSRWENEGSGDVLVGWGNFGNGTLNIENGGQIDGRAGAIGTHIASTGVTTVTGPGSSWITSLQMRIGSEGTGTLNIQDGGFVSNFSGSIATANRGIGTVTVTGPGSHWELNAVLRVGNIGTASLNINDGGLVTVGPVNGALTTIGENSTVNLHGGRFEFGSMSFDSLSRVSGTSGSLVGRTETISGSNQIESLNLEHLSSLDTSYVLVGNEGVIHGTGFANVGIDNQSTGEIRVMETDFVMVDGHSYNSGEINNFGGVVQFKSLTNRADGFIGGRGQFSTDEGLINEGVMAFTSDMIDIFGDVEFIGDGQLVTSGGAVTTFFGDVVHNGLEIRTAAGSRTVFVGELSGGGALTGAGELLVSGDLRPGNSPGTLHFEGDLTLTESANSFFEISGTGDGQFDKLIVDGDLHLSGLFSASFIDDYSLMVGDEFLIAEIGGARTGIFSGLNEGDLVAGAPGVQLSISYSMGDGNDIGLYATAVPEPGYGLILLLGTITAATRRRRNR